MLYLVATPIGNLADFSFRAVDVLKKVDLILCEDTRRSSILLSRYGIDAKLMPYHKFNEQKTIGMILERLKNGEEIALLSDAGTPCINDPGELLVKACVESELPFTSIPGPCSPIQALILSGFDTTRFQFLGFVPKSGVESFIERALLYPGTTILLESPERVCKTVEIIAKLAPKKNLALIREMTKTFEECIRKNAQDLADILKEKKILGEVCLVLEEGGQEELVIEPQDLILCLQENLGIDLKEAILMAAKLLKKSKREIYHLVHRKKSS